ncbi:DNA polymerase III subunit [Gemella cuniculi]|uniref:DNA polymerase III subunit n=1 Tax=Gemella cuniculi TaxID=150240 RepID=UPI00040CC3DF|nr:DNA polymerase III subunit [Gemella cuniculi]
MDFSKDSIAVKSLTNTLKTNKLSHAYLIVGEDSLYSDEFILQFVKAIFCLKNKDKDFFSCEECKNCKSINHDNYIDFYKISSNTSIKKEDIQILKSDLSVKSFYGKKIYWIKDIEKMTEQAANSILKFLEEPEENIIAILSCKNSSSILPTIISRCQQVKLVGKSENKITEDNKELEEIFFEFLDKNSKKIHLGNIYLLEKLKTKEDIVPFFLYASEKISYSYGADLSLLEIENISNVQEKILSAISDINSNVSAILVLEKFLFSIVVDGNNLEFLRRGR